MNYSDLNLPERFTKIESSLKGKSVIMEKRPMETHTVVEVIVDEKGDKFIVTWGGYIARDYRIFPISMLVEILP